MTAALEQIEDTLRRIFAEDGADQMLLARLGSRLRSELPDLDIEALGFRQVKDLVAACTSVGRLVRGQHDYIFILGAPRIRREWWNAVTAFDDKDVAWYDLATGTLVADATARELEPERYLDLPRFTEEQQLALARDWSSKQVDSDALLAALDENPTLKDFRAAIERLGQWSRARATAVSNLLLDWASEHGIERSNLLDAEPPRRHPQASSRPPRRAAGGGDLSRIRDVLHQAIDQMTVEELLEWRVPVRLLVERS